MIEIPRKYQTSYFGNIDSIKPEPDTIKLFLDMFKDEGLLPSTYQEIFPFKPPVTRLRLAAPDSGWRIDFDSPRIIIQKNLVDPSGENMGSIEDFIREMTTYYKRIFDRFPIKGTRLALVNSGLIREYPEDILSLIYKRVFNPIEFFQVNSPGEWKSRSVSKINIDLNGNQELLNIIIDLNRIPWLVPISEEAKQKDRIEIAFDINTFQGNTDTRFDMASLSAFYPEALRLRNDILVQIEGLINEQC